MTDNVVEFPQKELDVNVELDSEDDYSEIVHAVNTMLEMQVAGMMVTTDIEWPHVMDACMSLAVSAGLRAGMDTDEIATLLQNAKIHEVELDE